MLLNRCRVASVCLSECAAGTKLRGQSFIDVRRLKTSIFQGDSDKDGGVKLFYHWLEGVKYPEGVSFGSLEFMLLKQEGFRKC